MSKIFNISVDELINETEMNESEVNKIEDQTIENKSTKEKNTKVIIIIAIIIIVFIILLELLVNMGKFNVFNNIFGRASDTQKDVIDKAFSVLIKRQIL